MRIVLALCVVLLSASGPSFAQTWLAQTWLAQTSLTVPAPDWCRYQGQTIWEARRPAQNELARITVDLRCIDDVVSGVRVKAETRCGRAPCTWSFAEEAEAEGPSLRAVFFTFTATRFMRLELTGHQINVEVTNEYNQAGRQSDTMLAQFMLVD